MSGTVLGMEASMTRCSLLSQQSQSNMGNSADPPEHGESSQKHGTSQPIVGNPDQSQNPIVFPQALDS